jgi:hypothetical protein
MVLMRIKKRLKRESEEQETSRSISRENEIWPVRRMERALDCECACWRLAIREEHSAREVRVSRADWRSEQAFVLRAERTCHRAMRSQSQRQCERTSGCAKGARSSCARYDEVPTWPARYGSRSGGSGISHRQKVGAVLDILVAIRRQDDFGSKPGSQRTQEQQVSLPHKFRCLIFSSFI